MTCARIAADTLALAASVGVVAVATIMITAIYGWRSAAADRRTLSPTHRSRIVVVLNAVGFLALGSFVIFGAPIAAARLAELDRELGDLSAFVLGNSECVGIFFCGLVAALLLADRVNDFRQRALIANVLVGCIGIILAILVAYAICVPFLSGISELTAAPTTSENWQLLRT